MTSVSSFASPLSAERSRSRSLSVHPAGAGSAASRLVALPEVPSPGRVPTPIHLIQRATWVAERPELWRRHVEFTAERRHHVRLLQRPDVEIWLLTWLPGQGTGLHDHGGASGAFTVISGVLTETTVAPGSAGTVWTVDRTLREHSRRAFGAEFVHHVENRADVPAVSIHAYAPELTIMNSYEIHDGSLIRTATTREGDDW